MNDREFRQQLFERFSKTGLDKDIRAKVAEKLVKELKTSPQPTSQPSKPIGQQDLRNQILVSLISDYLEKKKCFTSKDVVEAELPCSSLLSPTELSNYFSHLPSVSVEVNGASKIFATKQPLSILERLAGHSIYQATVSKLTRAVQTEEDEGRSLHNKLQALDDKFAQFSVHNIKEGSNKKISDLQAIMKEEYEARLRREILAFKETELRNYRVKIDQQKAKEVREKELQMEQAYLAKLSLLKEREKLLYETIEKKAHELEKGDQETRRQQLLKLLEFEERDKTLSKERQTRLADIEARENKLEELERQLEIKSKDIDTLKAELIFNNRQIEKRMRVKSGDSERPHIEEHGQDGRGDCRGEEEV